MLLLFPFSCGVDHLLCFAYLQNDLNDPFQYAFWRSNLRVLLKNCTLYLSQYPHHLNQARRNEAESDRVRLLWDETPFSPPPPAKSWQSKQSNPVNKDAEGDIESVLINGVSI